ncbi:uncharacterized protein TNCV_1769231 [Trichonephila clavipes]|nr:uncharacterized protein TNCV_1769231 [Trichonephila clavipes]
MISFSGDIAVGLVLQIRGEGFNAVKLYPRCTPGGEPKSVKRLHDPVIYLLKPFLQLKLSHSYCPNLSSILLNHLHKSFNTARGIISEPDLYMSEAEILDGFTDQGIIQLPKEKPVGNAMKWFKECGIETYNPLVFSEHDFAAAKTSNHDVVGDATEINTSSANPQTLVVESQHINPPEEPEPMENTDSDAP